MSDTADAAGDDGGQGADLVFRPGAAADRRADESVARPLVAAEKEKVADDLPDQGSFQSLSTRERERGERDGRIEEARKEKTEDRDKTGKCEERRSRK